MSDPQEPQGLGEPDAAARLQRTLPLETECAQSGVDPDGLPEAALILIAHPEHRLLGSRYPLTRGGALEVGRAPTSNVSLPDVPSVSRHHARLHWADNGVQIEDLGSMNGCA